MKKFFYVFLSCAMLAAFAACGPDEPTPGPEDETPEFLDKSKTSSMVVTLANVPVASDTTIIVTDAEPSLSGAVQMGVRGTIQGVKAFRVTITRSEAGQKDELCAGQQCVPGDGELSQDIDYNMMGADKADWYTHYTPAKAGDYTVNYKFQNYNRELNIKVIYRYAE